MSVQNGVTVQVIAADFSAGEAAPRVFKFGVR